MSSPIPLPSLGALYSEVDRWQYPSRCGRGWGVCRLRIWRSPDGVDAQAFVAVVTELPDNPGPSITNSAESIILRLQDTLPGYLLVFEHYPAVPGSALRQCRHHRIDRVYLRGPEAAWQPVWPVHPSHPFFGAHQLWAQVYAETITGEPPAVVAPDSEREG